MDNNEGIKDEAKRFVGVLTGDITNSQSYSDDDINNILATLKLHLLRYAKQHDGHFDIYRGDAFQLAISKPQYSMHIALGLRLALKAYTPSVDVRISVGVGEGHFRPTEVKTGTGEAFVLSGRGLDTIKPYHLAFFSSNTLLESSVQLLTRFADNHVSGLTQTQSETLLAYLEALDKSHENIAAILNKTRSNVSRILNASNYKLVAEYLAYVAQAIAARTSEIEQLETTQVNKDT